MNWSYGITTVPKRIATLLPKTISSLNRGGFEHCRLFIDGADEETQKEYHKSFGKDHGLTFRYPQVRVYANWFLSMYELYLRNPQADRYVIFQDDILCSKNLRAYLDASQYPEKGFWNLYTSPDNTSLCPRTNKNRLKEGWFESHSGCRGALALVFNRNTLIDLFTSKYLATRPQDVNGWRAVDGGIASALLERWYPERGEKHNTNSRIGWREYVHNPSLVQHTGQHDTTLNPPRFWPIANMWKGEHFDCMTLINV